MSKQFVYTTEVIEDIKDRFDQGFVIPRHEKFWFKNLTLVKRSGITFNYTDEELTEYAKCMVGIDNVKYVTKEINGTLIKEVEGDVHTDPDTKPEMTGVQYFSEKYCKIKREDGSIGAMKLRDYQKDILDLYGDNRFSILMASRQVGKTVSAAISILHYIIFNNDKTVMVVANKSDTVVEILDKIKSIYYFLPWFLKPGVTNWNQKTMTFDTGCRIRSSSATKSAAIGFTVDFLYLDEFAHIQKNIIDDYYRSVFPTVAAIKNSKIVITSTPNGYNLFYKILTGAEKPVGDKEKNNYKSLRVYWWQVPGRYVSYIRFDEHVCRQYNIEPQEILNYIKELGFKSAELIYSSQSLRWEIHIPNREQDLPNHMKKQIQGREGENTVSDYFRGLSYERVFRGEKQKYKLVEFADVSSWKEDAIKDIGGEDKFNQEFDLQFANGNKQIFDSQTLDKMRNNVKDFRHIDIPLFNQKTFVNYDDLKWIDDPNMFNINDIKNYHLLFGVDLSEGLGLDYSVINIFRVIPKDESEWGLNIESINDFFKIEQIGLYRNNITAVPEIAELLYLLCFELCDENKVGVVLETNLFGGEVISKMKDLWQGRNNFGTHIFYRYKHRQDAVNTDIGLKLRQNKNLFVKEYQKRIRCNDIIVHEEGTVLEITTFVKEETRAGNIQFRADSGNDDVVMTVVGLSTVFTNIKFTETINEIIGSLPQQIKEKLEKRIGEAPNVIGADYSSLFKAHRAVQSSNPWNTNWGNKGGLGGFGWGSGSGSGSFNNPFSR